MAVVEESRLMSVGDHGDQAAELNYSGREIKEEIDEEESGTLEPLTGFPEGWKRCCKQDPLLHEFFFNSKQNLGGGR